MDLHINGKVALVTGGTQGIGVAIVKTLAAEGAKVAFCGRDEEKNEKVATCYRKSGYDVFPVQCDVSHSASVTNMFAKVADHYGTLDILVNNAATLRSNPRGYSDRLKFLELVAKPGKKFSLEITKNMPDEEWEAFIHNNLTSVFYCCREALNIMEAKKYGRIVNMASIAGLANKSAHSPHYSAAKGGIVAFTRSLALEVAGAGVTVNSVAPGMCAMEEPGWWDTFLKNMSQEGYELFLEMIPLGRFSTVQEQANAVAFLASDAASYITGQTLAVNGGMF